MSIYLINDADLRLYEDVSINVEAKRILVFVAKAQLLDLRMFLGKAFYDDFLKYFSNENGIANCVFSVKATTAANGNYQHQVPITPGDGAGGSFDITVYGGYVTGIKIVDPGKSFVIGDTLTFAAIPGAVFTVSEITPVLDIALNTPQPYVDLFEGVTYTDKAGHDITYNGIRPALAYWTFARFLEADAYRFTSTGVVTKSHDDAQPISEKALAAFVSQQRSTANAFVNDIEDFIWNNRSDYPLWRYSQRNKNARQPAARIRGIDRTQNNLTGYGTNDGNYGSYGIGGLIP